MWQLPQGIVVCFVYVPRTEGTTIHKYDDIQYLFREKKIDAYMQRQDARLQMDGWECYAILESGKAVRHG